MVVILGRFGVHAVDLQRESPRTVAQAHASSGLLLLKYHAVFHAFLSPNLYCHSSITLVEREDGFNQASKVKDVPGQFKTEATLTQTAVKHWTKIISKLVTLHSETLTYCGHMPKAKQDGTRVTLEIRKRTMNCATHFPFSPLQKNSFRWMKIHANMHEVVVPGGSRTGHKTP